MNALKNIVCKIVAGHFFKSQYICDFDHVLNDHIHDDAIKWKQFLHYWPFVRGIHWSPVDSPHIGQWHRALMSSSICA